MISGKGKTFNNMVFVENFIVIFLDQNGYIFLIKVSSPVDFKLFQNGNIL